MHYNLLYYLAHADSNQLAKVKKLAKNELDHLTLHHTFKLDPIASMIDTTDNDQLRSY